METLLRVWKQKKQNKEVTLIYSDTEKILLNYLQENKEITFRKFRQIAHISKNKAETILVKLILLDIITIHITEKATTYQLSLDNK